ncbi:hypothetical protein F3Y22_tig00111848pilonHSYRG00228 [Hibiscus syriacus]|uniref:Uncharacterized protein n=1 Tax=Hibiscus syriacus TaxID=106335 RepID=A0A6A2X9W4_HIBSY|nr:hypothetical protein F3Y22_tig00111848pilonHSYRG00228 [Hibiscus syriacus]
MFSGGVWVLRRFSFIGLDEALIRPWLLESSTRLASWKQQRRQRLVGPSGSWNIWKLERRLGRGPRVIITLGFPSGGF